MNIALKTGAAAFTVALCLGQTPPPAPPRTTPAKSTSGTVIPKTAPPVSETPDLKNSPAVDGQPPQATVMVEFPAAVPIQVNIPAVPFESAPSPLTAPVSTQAAAAPASPAGGRGPGVAAAQDSTPAKKPYVIGALDVLDVRVWNDPKLSGFFDVRPDGMISMPLIGEIRADGLTVAELRETILRRLNTLMNSPEVNVQVARINSKRYFIFGEVARSGEFPLVAEITLLDALSNCGGFREFANPRKIYVLRGSKKLEFNYKDVSRGKHMEQNIVLESGDRIFVP